MSGKKFSRLPNDAIANASDEKKLDSFSKLGRPVLFYFIFGEYKKCYGKILSEALIRTRKERYVIFVCHFMRQFSLIF